MVWNMPLSSAVFWYLYLMRCHVSLKSASKLEAFGALETREWQQFTIRHIWRCRGLYLEQRGFGAAIWRIDSVNNHIKKKWLM